MIILYILLAVILVIVLLLSIPVTYSLIFQKWNVKVKGAVLFGLLSKEMVFPSLKKKEEMEEEADDALDELNEALDELEERHGEKAAEDVKVEIISHGGNEETSHIDIENKKEISEEKEDSISEKEEKADREEGDGPSGDDEKISQEERKKPSLLAQFYFALDNGLIGEILTAVYLAIVHGAPYHWEVEGRLGTGNPMHTGILAGTAFAIWPKGAESIFWNYTDKEWDLKGKGQGRLIPLYVLYLLLRLALSREVRDFWHFRKGGKSNG